MAHSPIHLDKFNPIAHAAADLPLEGWESLMEDLAKQGYKGKGLIAQFVKKHEYFLSQRKLTLPAAASLGAIAAKVGQKFGMGNSLAAILYEFIKHGLTGGAEGLHEGIKASKEEKEASLHKQVDEAMTHVPDDPKHLPEMDANEFLGRIRKGDSVIHAVNKDCEIVTGFTDGHDAGAKSRDKIVLTAFSAGNKGGGKRGKGDDDGGGAGLIVKELKGDEKRVEYHSGNIVDLLKRGNTFLCKLCYPDGVPKEASHDKKHGDGLKETFGEKAMAVYTAATKTINVSERSNAEKRRLNDLIQEWKEVDKDIIAAKVEDIEIDADGKLSAADLGDFLGMIDAAGKKKQSPLHTFQELFDDGKAFLGDTSKKDEKPLIDQYSTELVDFLRASENRYNGMDSSDQAGFAHLKDVLKLPDLSKLDEFAQAFWSKELLGGQFKDEQQFQAWNSTVMFLAKAKEYDAERKHPTLRKVGRIGAALYKMSGYAFLTACVLFVLGWCFAGFYLGAMTAGFAGLAALLLTVFLAPISGAFSILDWFLKDKNRIDDFVRGVQSTLVIYFASMMVLVWLLYLCQFPAPAYVGFFLVLTGSTIAASFGLKKAQAFVTLQNNLKLASLVFGGIYGVILIGSLLGASLGLFGINAVPKLQSMGANVDEAMNDESDEDEGDEPAATTGAVTGQDPSFDAMEKLKQEAREVKAAAPAAVASTAPPAKRNGNEVATSGQEDGMKAYCRSLKEKAPLVYAQVPNCQGV